MLNPVFFIPMVFCNVVMGFIGLFATQNFAIYILTGYVIITMDNLIFCKSIFSRRNFTIDHGITLLVVNTLMYYPFFRIADKKAY